MIDNIQNILNQIIGLQLSGTSRAANMECLNFGDLIIKKKDDKTCYIGEFSIHLQCSWRFTNDNIIIVGSSDLYVQADESAEYDVNFDWDVEGANFRDVKLKDLISNNILIVHSTQIDKFGGLEINFNNNIKLSIFPDRTSKSYYEYWRIIDFRNQYSKHYISSTDGYEIDSD